MRIATIASIALITVLAGCSTMNAANTASNNPTSVPPGMNEKGEVIDSTKVEPGYGTKVTGINGFEGEIVGKPAKNSKFPQLQIGMSTPEVLKIMGEPTAQATRLTSKAYIPVYAGKDRSRHMLVYKGQGRLILSGGPRGAEQIGTLLYIIHNASESGTL